MGDAIETEFDGMNGLFSKSASARCPHMKREGQTHLVYHDLRKLKFFMFLVTASNVLRDHGAFVVSNAITAIGMRVGIRSIVIVVQCVCDLACVTDAAISLFRCLVVLMP